MNNPVIFWIGFFLIIWIIILIWTSRRFVRDNRPMTPLDYLWRLRQITGKNEYELFQIAAEEKGWPGYHVESHFKRYLADETLPVYVKEFLEDGREYIDAFRFKRGELFSKRLFVSHGLLALLIIGGTFVLCVYIFPVIMHINHWSDSDIVEIIRANPRFARPFIERAIARGLKGQSKEACADLKLACELGYCDEYLLNQQGGVCP